MSRVGSISSSPSERLTTSSRRGPPPRSPRRARARISVQAQADLGADERLVVPDVGPRRDPETVTRPRPRCRGSPPRCPRRGSRGSIRRGRGPRAREAGARGQATPAATTLTLARLLGLATREARASCSRSDRGTADFSSTPVSMMPIFTLARGGEVRAPRRLVARSEAQAAGRAAGRSSWRRRPRIAPEIPAQA